MAERRLAIVGNYDELTAALRARVAELGTTFDGLDELSGLPERYTQKVLSRGCKSLGRVSLGPILQTLGLKLAVIVDDEQTAKMRPRLARDRWPEKRRAFELTRAG
jgi:hypothetical protein